MECKEHKPELSFTGTVNGITTQHLVCKQCWEWSKVVGEPPKKEKGMYEGNPLTKF